MKSNFSYPIKARLRSKDKGRAGYSPSEWWEAPQSPPRHGVWIPRAASHSGTAWCPQSGPLRSYWPRSAWKPASLDGHTSLHHCNLRTWYNCQQQRCSLFILICFVFPWIHHTQQFWIMFCCHQCKYAGGDLWIRHTPVFYSIKCVESRFNLTIPNSSFFKNNDTKLLPHHHPITLIIPSVDARPTALLTLPECAWLCRLSFLGRTCTTWTHLRLRQR